MVSHGKDKEIQVKVALKELLSQFKKDFFYNENHQSGRALPRKW